MFEAENIVQLCQQTAGDLAQQLRQAVTKGDWSIETVDTWWDRHQRGHPPLTTSTDNTAEESQYASTMLTNSGTLPHG